MKALINDSTGDIIPEGEWLDWFGPDGEDLIARMPGYRLIANHFPDEPAPEPEQPQQTEDPRIAQLEAEIAAIRGGSA